MSVDMTYHEVNEIKSNIRYFINEIKKSTQRTGFDFCQSDQDFFSFIAKHIVFFKYLYLGNQNIYFYKVLISDLYYLILSIIDNKTRYMYLNERSIIENYIRCIMRVSIQDNHITKDVFEEMRRKSFKCDFSDTLIKSEYIVSCGYIHGGEILNDNLAFVFEQCSNNNLKICERKKYYLRLQKILKTFDKLFITENDIYISGCFHRKKSILEYLLGKEKVNLLFELLE